MSDDNKKPPAKPYEPKYNASAVNEAIGASNKAGRKIGGKEASAIHRLLKGRHDSFDDDLASISDALDGLNARFDAFCAETTK